MAIGLCHAAGCLPHSFPHSSWSPDSLSAHTLPPAPLLLYPQDEHPESPPGYTGEFSAPQDLMPTWEHNKPFCHIRTWLGIWNFSDGQLHTKEMWMKWKPALGCRGRARFFLVCLPWRPGASEQQDIRYFSLQAAKLVQIILVTGLFCGGQATPTP